SRATAGARSRSRYSDRSVRRCRSSLGTSGHSRLAGAAAALALCREPLEVAAPLRLPVAAELVEYRPRVQAGIVAVVEHEPHRIVADRLDPLDPNRLLARDQQPFSRGVTFDFSRRGVDP